MEKYDYYIKVANDIECWMDKDGDPFDLSQFKSREEVKERQTGGTGWLSLAR